MPKSSTPKQTANRKRPPALRRRRTNPRAKTSVLKRGYRMEQYEMRHGACAMEEKEHHFQSSESKRPSAGNASVQSSARQRLPAVPMPISNSSYSSCLRLGIPKQFRSFLSSHGTPDSSAQDALGFDNTCSSEERNHPLDQRSIVRVRKGGIMIVVVCDEGGYHPFFLANRLLRSTRTFDTLNCTYSKSRSSWLSFCISRRSSSFRSSSSNPRFRPDLVSTSSPLQPESRTLTLVVKRDDKGSRQGARKVEVDVRPAVLWNIALLDHPFLL